jgi:hypothetical protein
VDAGNCVTLIRVPPRAESATATSGRNCLCYDDLAAGGAQLALWVPIYSSVLVRAVDEILGTHNVQAPHCSGGGNFVIADTRHVAVVVEYSAARLDLGFWRRHDRHPCASRWLTGY